MTEQHDRNSNAPDPDEIITLAQAADETGLHRQTLWNQSRMTDKDGQLRLVLHDFLEHSGRHLDKRWRASGGGWVARITRRELHRYLLSRSPSHAGRINADYQTPCGMEELPPHMRRPAPLPLQTQGTNEP